MQGCRGPNAPPMNLAPWPRIFQLSGPGQLSAAPFSPWHSFQRPRCGSCVWGMLLPEDLSGPLSQLPVFPGD